MNIVLYFSKFYDFFTFPMTYRIKPIKAGRIIMIILKLKLDKNYPL